MITRRTVLKGVGAAGALMLGPGSVLRADEKSITITSLGGKWEQSIREHFIPLFKERTGAEVQVVLGTPSQWSAQIEAQPGNPPLDAIDPRFLHVAFLGLCTFFVDAQPMLKVLFNGEQGAEDLTGRYLDFATRLIMHGIVK